MAASPRPATHILTGASHRPARNKTATAPRQQRPDPITYHPASTNGSGPASLPSPTLTKHRIFMSLDNVFDRTDLAPAIAVEVQQLDAVAMPVRQGPDPVQLGLHECCVHDVLVFALLEV